MMQSDSLSSHTPSFNNHSSRVLSDIAARVIGEFEFDYEEYGICEDEFERNKQPSSGRMEEEEEEEEKEEEEEVENCEESEFSFSNLGSEASSLISADEIFYNGQIRPVFPVFDTELYLKNEEDHEIRNMIHSAIGKKAPAPPLKVRAPLVKLFEEEREASSCGSSSSSAEDELNGVPPEIYCAWKPGKGEDEETLERCKKSNSTGMSSSSRRWRFREMIRRSRSDGGGKEDFGV